MSQAPSKYAQRVQRRAIFLGIFIVVVFGLYSWLKNYLKDPFDNPSDTRDLIAAVKQTRDGSQLVTLTEGGTEKACPEYVEGKTDKEPVWRPDGNIIAFLTDREGGAFLVHRWSLGADQQERRTAGTRSFTSAYFGPFGDTSTTVLATQGGQVFSVDLRENVSKTILPPTDAQNANGGAEGGSQSSFQSLYEKYGSAFTEAKWYGDHAAVVAILKRDNGETLVIQPLNRIKAEDGSLRTPAPTPIVAGDHISFDLSISGKLVIAVQGFQFPDQDNIPPQFIKNGAVVPPYRNGLLFINVEDILAHQDNKETGLIAVNPDDKVGFGRPRISPDGARVVTLTGPTENEQLDPKALVVFPIKVNAAEEGRVVHQGSVMSAEWHPAGEKLVMIERVAGKPGVYVVAPSGSDYKKVSDSAEFLSASYSPQVKKS